MSAPPPFTPPPPLAPPPVVPPPSLAPAEPAEVPEEPPEEPLDESDDDGDNNNSSPVLTSRFGGEYARIPDGIQEQREDNPYADARSAIEQAAAHADHARIPELPDELPRGESIHQSLQVSAFRALPRTSVHCCRRRCRSRLSSSANAR